MAAQPPFDFTKLPVSQNTDDYGAFADSLKSSLTAPATQQPQDQADFDTFSQELQASGVKPKNPLWQSAKSAMGHGVKSLGTVATDIGLPVIGEPLRQFGQDVQDNNPARIQALGDIVEHPLTALQEGVGQALGSLPVSLGGAWAGAKAGAMLPLPPPARAVTAGLGGILGAFAPNLVAEYGESRDKQVEAGIDDPMKALGYGTAAAGVESLADATVLGRFLPKPLREALPSIAALPEGAGFIQRVAQAGKAGLLGAGMEGATEIIQTYLENLGGGQPINTPQAHEEALLSGALGALGGGAIRGGIELVSPTREEQPQDPNIPQVPPQVSPQAGPNIPQLPPPAPTPGLEGPQIAGLLPGYDYLSSGTNIDRMAGINADAVAADQAARETALNQVAQANRPPMGGMPFPPVGPMPQPATGAPEAGGQRTFASGIPIPELGLPPSSPAGGANPPALPAPEVTTPQENANEGQGQEGGRRQEVLTPPAGGLPPAAPGPLSTEDLSNLFDEAAAEATQEKARDPKAIIQGATRPGLPTKDVIDQLTGAARGDQRERDIQSGKDTGAMASANAIQEGMDAKDRERIGEISKSGGNVISTPDNKVRIAPADTTKEDRQAMKAGTYQGWLTGPHDTVEDAYQEWKGAQAQPTDAKTGQQGQGADLISSQIEPGTATAVTDTATAAQETPNAQQEQEPGTPDGGSGTRPGVRQEGGSAAEGGAGVQSGGQGQQAPVQGHEGEKGQVASFWRSDSERRLGQILTRLKQIEEYPQSKLSADGRRAMAREKIALQKELKKHKEGRFSDAGYRTLFLSGREHDDAFKTTMLKTWDEGLSDQVKWGQEKGKSQEDTWADYTADPKFPREISRSYFNETWDRMAAQAKGSSFPDDVKKRALDHYAGTQSSNKGYAKVKRGALKTLGKSHPGITEWARAEHARQQEAKRPKLIGKNKAGKNLYEDAHGHRSIEESPGILVGETVGVRPTREGVQAELPEHKDEYLTAEEWAAKTPATTVEDPLSVKVLPLPKYIAQMSLDRRDMFGIDYVGAASMRMGGVDIQAEHDGRGGTLTPETAMLQLYGSLDAVAAQDALLRRNVRSGATVAKLWDAWKRAQMTLNLIHQSQKDDPEIWKIYEQRQEQVKNLNVGDKVRLPYYIPEAPHYRTAIITKKNKVRWSLKGVDHLFDTPLRPEGLRPVETKAPEPETKPAESETPKPSPKLDLIERIVNAAESGYPVYRVVERKRLKGTDGQWHTAGSMPIGVQSTGETQSYWVRQGPDGTTSGVMRDTREEAQADLDAIVNRRKDNFRSDLEQMSEDDLQKQADYWLKGGKPLNEQAKENKAKWEKPKDEDNPNVPKIQSGTSEPTKPAGPVRAAVKFGSYNAKRYSKPWIALVSAWPTGGKPSLAFGGYVGDDRGGEAETQAMPGQVVRYGQKDYRGNGTENKWGVVNDDGSVREVSMVEAKQAFNDYAQRPKVEAKTPPVETRKITPQERIDGNDRLMARMRGNKAVINAALNADDENYLTEFVHQRKKELNNLLAENKISGALYDEMLAAKPDYYRHDALAIRNQIRFSEKQKAPEPAPPKVEESPETAKARQDLEDALADLGQVFLDAGLFSKKAVNTGIDEAKLIPVLTRLLDAAFRLGYHKFKDAARYAVKEIRDRFGDAPADAITLDHLQGAYIGMAGKYQGKGADTKRDVIAVDNLAEIYEAPSDVLNTQTGIDDTGTLENVPPGQGPGTEGGGDVGVPGQENGGGNPQANADHAPAGVHGPAGGGNRPQGKRPARAGGGGGRRGGGKRRTGTGVSEGHGELLGAPGDAVRGANVPAVNFQITDDVRLGKGGEIEKFNDNLAAIRALKQIEAENRRATPEEQRALARYVGWGGLANAFDDGKGNFKPGWEARGKELADLLSPDEMRTARRSTRNAHYTSKDVVDAMWAAAERLGFNGGLVLEPSAGVGNFLGLMPEGLRGNSHAVAVEFDGVSARIAKLLYPQSGVLHTGFQKIPLPDGAFDLAIGNPPFGSESLNFIHKPQLNGRSIHNQFFLGSLESLRPGGLQIMVVSRYLMDKVGREDRLAIAEKAELLGAIRLPDTAFKENARTEVVTDILFLQRRTPEGEARMRDAIDALKPSRKKLTPAEQNARRALSLEVPEWVRTVEVKDPQGGEPMAVGQYFAANPHMMLGTLERSGSMRHAEDITLRPDPNVPLAEGLRKAIEHLQPIAAETRSEATDKESKRLFDGMVESLQLMIEGKDAGDMRIDPDGRLIQVVEREAPNGDTNLTTRVLTPQSPWSKKLYQDDHGRWFTLEPRLDEKGNKIKQGNSLVYDRQILGTDDKVPATLRLGDTRYDRIKQLIHIRDAFLRQVTLEAENAPDTEIEKNRQQLARLYDAFVAQNGYVNDPKNAGLIGEMPDEGLILALEMKYQAAITAKRAETLGIPARPASAQRAAILDRRVTYPYEAKTQAASAQDALIVSLSETGGVDMPRIARLLNVPEDTVEDLLVDADGEPLVFHDPEEQKWVTKDEYLTGNVRQKLNAARDLNVSAKNIRALEKVQPEPWEADVVTPKIGGAWIPEDVYGDFLKHLIGGDTTVRYLKLTNSFSVNASARKNELARSEWGTQDYDAAAILEKLLNSQTPVVYREDAEGHRWLDEEATAEALLKVKAITREFDDWIFQDAGRRDRLVSLFNDAFNTRVVRQFDGSHLELPGKVPDEVIKFNRNQLNAVWRGIATRFMLIDHAVGAGKTFISIARAMERKRLGLSRKAMVTVPNHLVASYAADVYRLYPGAKVLAAGKEDMSRKNRRRMFAKIASGDWDVVVVPHSSFKFIQVSPETELRYLEDELAIAEAAVQEAEEQAADEGMDQGWRKPFNVKQAEAQRTKIEERIAKLQNATRDKLLSFEQLGVDDLTVDEAHEFKNLFYYSRLIKVRGMGNKLGSQQAFGLYNKTRVLRDMGGSVVFMTGTPISNSAVEMYNMMRYLIPDQLEALGLSHFDAWRAQFVDVSTKFEPNEAGQLDEVTRMGREWANMRALMDLWYGFTDAVTNDDIKQWYEADNPGKKFPLPQVKDGPRRLIKLTPTPLQNDMLREILQGFASLPNIDDVDERNAERLRLMNRARNLATDVRVAEPGITSDEAGGKLEAVVNEVERLYRKWHADKGTQLVFLDRSTPKSKGDDKRIKEFDKLVADRDKALREDDEEAFREINEKLEKFDPEEIEAMRQAQKGGWNAYQQIKSDLVKRGIPAGEIRFIHEANTDEQKKNLFDLVNSGEVRVLLGSTPRLGAGTNVQERLVGLHHVDVTWKPSDIEQREGRIIRQGNALLQKYGIDNFEVEILAYATERTIDAKMWDLNATKLKMLNGIRKYDGSFNMTFEDADSVSMAEIAALASGNPLLLERVQLMSKVDELELMERTHRRKQMRIESSIARYTDAIENNPRKIEKARDELEKLKTEQDAVLSRSKNRTVTVEGKAYPDKFYAMLAATNAMDAQMEASGKKTYAIEVEGQRLTSKEAIENAIDSVIGDVATFEMEIQGKTFVSRTMAARQIDEYVQEKAKDMQDGDRLEEVIGKVWGRDVKLDIATTHMDKRGRITNDWRFSGALSLTQGDSTLVSWGFDWEIGEKPGTVKVRKAVEEVYNWNESRSFSLVHQIRSQENDLQVAKENLPQLEGKGTEPFQQAEELKAARQRLGEVTLLLAQDPNAAAIVQQSDQAMFSRPTSRHRGTTVSALREHYSSTFGPGIGRLEAAGTLNIVQSLDELPAELRQVVRGDEEGVYWHGKAWIVAGNVSLANANQVLLHELGEHYGLKRMIGEKAYTELQGRISTLYRMGNARVKEAWDSVLREYRDDQGRLLFKEGSEAHLREVIAQLGQSNVFAKSQWWRALLSKIKAFLLRIGLGRVVRTLTDADLNALLVASVHHAARMPGAPSVFPQTAQASRPAEIFYSELAQQIGQVKATKAPAAQWKAIIAGLKQKGVKQDEIEWSGINEWLDLAQGPVTKEQVQAFLEGNGVRVEEVSKGSVPAKKWERPSLTSPEAREAWENSKQQKQDEAQQQLQDELYLNEGNESPDPDEVDRLAREIFEREWNEGEWDEWLGGNQDELQPETKYAQWQLPGGENYQELLITLPSPKGSYGVRKVGDRWAYYHANGDLAGFSDNEAQARRAANRLTELEAGTFRSAHWDEPNILAHVRFNERTDSDGKKVLFIEEIQSDWAAEGRKQGFVGDLPTGFTSVQRNGYVGILNPEGVQIAMGDTREEAIKDYWASRTTRDGGAYVVKGIPKAPFVTDTKAYVALVLKRMIRHAAEIGADRIAFTTGEQQADRYDLSKQVESIGYQRRGEGLYQLAVWDKNGNEVYRNQSVAEGDLEDIVGKEMAKKIVAGEGRKEGNFTYMEGLDLKVGGSGMRGFYDSIVPQVANSLLKKFGGGKVGEVALADRMPGINSRTGEPRRTIINRSIQPGFDITPQLRDRALQGLPLFRRAPDERLARARAQGFDTSQVWYHGTPVGNDIRAFDLGKTGAKTGSRERAVFLTDTPDVAAAYGYQDEITMSGDSVTAEESYGSILPVYVRGKLYDARAEVDGKRYNSKLFAALVAKAKGLGYAGVDFGRVVDVPAGTPYGTPAGRVIAMFKPGDIRSVFAEFDPARQGLDDLLFSRPIRTPGRPYSEQQEATLGKFDRGAPLTYFQSAKARLEASKGRWKTHMRQALVDRYASFKDVLGSERLWMLGHLSHTAGGAIEAVLRFGAPKLDASGALDIEANKPSMRSIVDMLGPETDDWLKWIAGNRAANINRKADTAERVYKQLKDMIRDTKSDIQALQKGLPLSDPGAYAQARIAGLKNDIKALRKDVQDLMYGNITTEGRRYINGLNRLIDAKEAEIALLKDPTTQKDKAKQINARNKAMRQMLALAKEAKRAKEIRERFLKPEDIAALMTLNQGDMADGRNRARVYEEARQKFEALSDAVVRIGVETGTISEAEADRWSQEGFYVPFYRFLEDETGDNTYGVRGLDSLTGQTAYKQFKGADIPLNDLLTNVVLNWHHILDSALKNQAAREALDVSVGMGLAKAINPAAKKAGDVFVRIGGKRQYFRLDDTPDAKMIAQSLAAMQYKGLNNFAMKLMNRFKRALTFGVTVSPQFKIRNLIRDSIQAMAAAQVSPNVMENLWKGWNATHFDSQSYARMIMSGGAFGDSGYLYGGAIDREAILQDIGNDQLLDSKPKLEKLLRGAFQTYQDFGARLENINRAAEFERRLGRGDSLLEASFSARDQLDFSRHGALSAVYEISQVVPFINARLQGMDKLARAMKDPRQRKQFAIVTGVYITAAVALYLAMKDDDDYKELEQWKRDAYHAFKLPGSETMYFIPRPFEIGAMATIVERAAEQLVDDKAHGKLFAERLGHVLADNLNFNPTPQLFIPALEVMANKDFYTGRRLESLGMEQLSPAERKRAWTSETAIGLSKGMDAVLWDKAVLSPIQVEHLVNGYLGWMGAFTLGSLDFIYRNATGAPDKPAMKAQDKFVIGGFMAEGPQRNTRYVTEFYENLDAANKAYSDIRHNLTFNRKAEAHEIQVENRKSLAWRARYNQVQKTLSKLNKQAELIQAGRLPADAKRAALDRINKQRNEYTRRIVEQSGDFS